MGDFQRREFWGVKIFGGPKKIYWEGGFTRKLKTSFLWRENFTFIFRKAHFARWNKGQFNEPILATALTSCRLTSLNCWMLSSKKPMKDGLAVPANLIAFQQHLSIHWKVTQSPKKILVTKGLHLLQSLIDVDLKHHVVACNIAFCNSSLLVLPRHI